MGGCRGGGTTYNEKKITWGTPTQYPLSHRTTRKLFKSYPHPLCFNSPLFSPSFFKQSPPHLIILGDLIGVILKCFGIYRVLKRRGVKLENLRNKKPKSTLLVDGFITTKQTNPRPVASAAPHPITPGEGGGVKKRNSQKTAKTKILACFMTITIFNLLIHLILLLLFTKTNQKKQ